MKRLVFLLAPLLLSACQDKNDYHAAVLKDIEKEQGVQQTLGLKEYAIAPAELSDCIVVLSSDNMPGLFAYDPKRPTAYRNYSKMLAYRNLAKELVGVDNPQKTLSDARKKLVEDFASEQALSQAMANYSESHENCYASIISKSEDAEKNKEPVETASDSAK